MRYHAQGYLDSTDPRISRLVLYGIYRQENIQSLYARCGELFEGFLAKEPRLAAEVHRFMYLDRRSMAQDQAWERQAPHIANGGPEDQAVIVSSDFESAKFLLLPLAIAIQATRGKDGERLGAIFCAFQGKAKSVLQSVAKEFVWLFPDIDAWATIRNSEHHQSTVFDGEESRVVFADLGKRVKMAYEELARFTHHETTGMVVSNDAITACFLKRMKLTLPPDLVEGDQEAIRTARTKRLRQTRGTRPTAEEHGEAKRRRPGEGRGGGPHTIE